MEPGFTLAESRPQMRKGGADPLLIAAAVFFLLAVGFCAVTAFNAGAGSAAGLLLLTGLAGVTFIALIALRSAARQGPAAGAEELADLVGALDEPACVCGADGLIAASNAAWRDSVGAARRLPKNGSGLFTALSDARRGGRGRGAMRTTRAERSAAITLIGQDRFLLRLAPVAEAAAPAPAAAAPVNLGHTPAALDAFASASPFGAALIDGTDAFAAPILEANSALAAIAGEGAVPGATLGALLSAETVAEVAASLAAGRQGPFEVKPASQPDVTASLYLAPAGGRTVAYLVDVTEQKKLQLQLAQRNKMEAIGQLAGGVAHDFNNLLTAIQLRLDELLLRHPLGDPSYDGLSEIRQTAVRAADLVRQLLTFSRKATVQRVTLDLGEMVSNFQVLLRRLLREDVKLETDYGLNLPLVRADKAQLENAVMNLVVNARDAVHANGGGTVRLRTARVSEAEAQALGYAGAPMGEMAMIEVADDGPGIPPEVIGNIFEPFFTTKAVGEGTGLGLATVYGIVKQSDGWISVQSRFGHGAAFRIFLPVYTPPILPEAPVLAPKPKVAARDLSGAGRILFVEDEEAVRGIAARLLRARGYEVIEAADGEEALELAEANAGTIDLMISDVIMPGIDGPTLLKKARGFLGTAPVMFISGYAESEFSDLLEGETGVSFLPKPIDIKTLAERVKQQLQGLG
ncbi:cell cycle histidine kinase CckA [Caulobacter sp. KR2-114]|uniref:cell cycle histidine kinase CckA n=1 Tax=Caulobacter sp. KR2-114 TaxID=3400912 RepID=UPI003C0A6A0D